MTAVAASLTVTPYDVTSRSFKPHHFDDDNSLVERAKQGDVVAFELLVEPYLEKLFKSIWKITRNREDAEDSLQETLLKAFTHLDQFRGASRFSTWLITIGVNQALMSLRTRRKNVISLEANEPSSATPPSSYLPEPRLNPEQQCRNTEWAELLDRVIDTLPPPFRTVFELRYVHELSNEQAAMALGISIAAVKTRALRARRHIGRRLGERWKRDRHSINGGIPVNGGVQVSASAAR
jgi:RNA polymerase sigma-70 factor, ECF subfamily